MVRLEPESSLLLVVDVQERLAAAMPPPAMERLVTNARLLLEAARLLRVPVVATEQYPKGLGPTIAGARRTAARGRGPAHREARLRRRRRAARRRRPSRSRRRAPSWSSGWRRTFASSRRCASSREGATRVFVVADAVASRREENRVLGLSLCASAPGAIVLPAESVVFDWLRRGGDRGVQGALEADALSAPGRRAVRPANAAGPVVRFARTLTACRDGCQLVTRGDKSSQLSHPGHDRRSVPSAPSLEGPIPEPSPDAITVLVVDDERSNVESLEKIFLREGMRTLLARRTRSAPSSSCARTACTSCSPT